MSEGELAARRVATQQAFYRLLPGRAVADGVYASVVPASPDRSLFNAVTYRPGAPVPPLPDLAELYAGAGVRAWTVWVLPEDRALARALSEAGHALDATPEAMGAELGALDLSGPDVAVPATFDDLVATNAAAYGVPAGELDAMRLAGDGAMRLYGAGGGAIVLAIHEHAGDAGVTFVAARPEARGRGLVAALLRQALRDALAYGCTTTTLEATRLGRPVYERVGYRSLGTLEMWERRAPVRG